MLVEDEQTYSILMNLKEQKKKHVSVVIPGAWGLAHSKTDC